MTGPAAATPDPAALPDPAASRAVLVGVHEGCTTIGDWAHDLPAVRNNVTTLSRILTDGTVWDLPPASCVEVLQPTTPRDVLDRLEDAASQATDTLIVYLAGHGVLDDAGRLHLVLPGARFDYHCLPYDHVRACLTRHRRARKTVVIIDCCFSGRALDGAMGGQDRTDLPGLIRDTTLIEGAAVLTACSAHLTAVAPEGAEFTVFTGELISVLTEGVPDGPPLLTLHTVHDELVRRVARRPGLPIPQLGTRGHGGRIPLARNSAFREAAAAPRPGAHRSVYLRQVEQIAPRRLVGRDAELAELAAFCQQPDTEDDLGYLWWRAPAWSGKSALLAWFTLHPPEKTRVVAFFITARFAGQSDLNAFLNAMIEQLTALVDEPEPVSRLDRLPWFYDLLDEAARQCRKRGERLVLLVDGLDEDRGVREGPYGTSIAGVLPSHLPAGMRVVLSGRPHPPLPDDVAARHPLRDEEIIRPLQPWGGAESTRESASFELRGLLREGGAGYEVLALLTAAGGGLSLHDLAELTGQTPWQIEDLLLGPVGRTFTRRPGRRDPDDAARAALMLAHEELTVTAEAKIGTRELAAFADRIHQWADRYRDRGWPVDTPEYLLTGYLSLLRREGSLERMATYVSDAGRADRLFALTGGDSAAIEDIADVQRSIRDQDEPDLGQLLTLAIVRERLGVRNDRIPVRLPVVWASLGQIDRAENLARSMDYAFRPADSLIELVKAAAESGDDTRAWELATMADAVIRRDEESLDTAPSLLNLIRAVAPTGDSERIGPLMDWAEEISSTARGLFWPDYQTSFAEVAALCGQVERAIRVAGNVSNQEWYGVVDNRGHVLASVVEALAQSGRIDDARKALSNLSDPINRARALTALLPASEDMVTDADAIRQIATSMTSSYNRAVAQAGLVEALARAGHTDEAAQMLDTIDYDHEANRSFLGVEEAMVDAFCRLAQAETERHDPARALAYLDRAEHVASFIKFSSTIAAAVTKIAAELVRAGASDRAERLVAAMADDRSRGYALAALAREVARVGDTDRAECIASGIEDSYTGALGLTSVAEAVVERGDRRRAEALANRAESMARACTAPTHRALSKLVYAVGLVGDLPRARRVAACAEQAVRTEIQSDLKYLALADIARSLARLDDVAGAAQLTQSIRDSFSQELPLVEVVKAMARAGDMSAAVRMAGSIRTPLRLHEAMTGLAVVAARQSDVRLAVELAVLAGKRLWEAFPPGTDPANLAEGIVRLMEAAAWIGNRQWLRDLAESARRILPHGERETVANAWVAEALAWAGAVDEAHAVADALVNPVSRASVQTNIARALARNGDVPGAERIAAGITAPRQQAEAISLIAEYAVPSRRLLADALCRGPYALLLAPVALVDPQAVLRAADLIEGAE